MNEMKQSVSLGKLDFHRGVERSRKSKHKKDSYHSRHSMASSVSVISALTEKKKGLHSNKSVASVNNNLKEIRTTKKNSLGVTEKEVVWKPRVEGDFLNFLYPSLHMEEFMNESSLDIDENETFNSPFLSPLDQQPGRSGLGQPTCAGKSAESASLQSWNSLQWDFDEKESLPANVSKEELELQAYLKRKKVLKQELSKGEKFLQKRMQQHHDKELQKAEQLLKNQRFYGSNKKPQAKNPANQKKLLRMLGPKYYNNTKPISQEEKKAASLYGALKLGSSSATTGGNSELQSLTLTLDGPPSSALSKTAQKSLYGAASSYPGIGLPGDLPPSFNKVLAHYQDKKYVRQLERAEDDDTTNSAFSCDTRDKAEVSPILNRKEQRAIAREAARHGFFHLFHQTADVLNVSSSDPRVFQRPHADFSKFPLGAPSRNAFVSLGEVDQSQLVMSDAHSDKRGSRESSSVSMDFSHYSTMGDSRNSLYSEIQPNKGQKWEPFIQACFDLEINPEPVASKFFNNDFSLAYYSLGQKHMEALARGFKASPDIVKRLDLRSNRLTSKSVIALLDALEKQTSLTYLSLAENNISGKAMQHLGNYLQHTCALHIREMNLSQTKLQDNDIMVLLTGLLANMNLRKLNLCKNSIKSAGAEYIAEYINSLNLKKLDLSWNDLTGPGIEKLGKALMSNSSLQEINFSYNRIGDFFGQDLASCLMTNKSLRKLNFTQCGIGGKTAVVFGKTLRMNSTLEDLNLSLNSLTEVGGRAVLRAVVVDGIKSSVTLSGCSFQAEEKMLDKSNPPPLLEVTLDLSKPYDVATVEEILEIYRNSPPPASLEIDQSGARKMKSFKLRVTEGGQIVDKKGSPYAIPENEMLQIRMYTRRKVGGMNLLDKDMLQRLIMFMKKAVVLQDTINALHLICKDVCFKTAQAQELINVMGNTKPDGTIIVGESESTQENKQVLDGIPTVVIMEKVWPKIVDSQKLFDFLLTNLRVKKQQYELAGALTVARFGFNVHNATGHYTLSLANRGHVEILQLLAALQTNEKNQRERLAFEMSEKYREMGDQKKADEKFINDTSQNGNKYPNMPYSNFRNEKLIEVNGSPKENFKVTQDFLNDPKGKVLEFDYVSTTRPLPDQEPMTKPEFDDMLVKLHLGHINPHAEDTILSHKLFFIATLRLAATGGYFSTEQVIRILDIFGDPSYNSLKVQIVCAFFSRIVDLERFDRVLNTLPSGSGITQEVVQKLGILNIINPIELSLVTYEIDLRYRDQRLAVREMIRLGHVEEDNLDRCGDCERDLTDLNAMLPRLEEMYIPAIMRLKYRILHGACIVNWDKRIDFLERTLVGTKPWSPKVQEMIDRGKEMKEEGFGSEGSIAEQYAAFLKHKEEQQRSDSSTLMRPASRQRQNRRASALKPPNP